MTRGILLGKRSAFTLLEIIFVIVILGIVASIGTQIIVQVYERYITQKAIHNSSLKTELAATQLANRLAYSIPSAVIAREDDNRFYGTAAIPDNSDANILEWIGYDADSFGSIFNANRRPIWSGYCDTAASTKNAISTPGSRLRKLNTVVRHLSGSNTRMFDGAILFPDITPHSVGFSETDRNDTRIHSIAGRTGNTILNLDLVPNARTIHEHYKLAWTAYAVVPTQLDEATLKARGFKTTDEIFDLTLYYDYQPWDGEKYSDAGVKSQLLITNVSVFRFTGSADSIRIKICQRETTGGTHTINSCKEKAVIR